MMSPILYIRTGYELSELAITLILWLVNILGPTHTHTSAKPRKINYLGSVNSFRFATHCCC